MPERSKHAIADTFVELADTLASDYDIGEFLHLLAQRCHDILRVDAGAVLLEDESGALRLAAATSEKMEHLEASEMRNDEGPCIDAYRLVERVVAEDLELERDRWPTVAREALDLGMAAV